MVDKSKAVRLEELIASFDSVIVAFSGGADSSLLLAVSLRVLGADRVLAVTADSPTLPRSELEEAAALARQLGARHTVITTAEMEDECFASNPPERCYYCKQELFVQLRALGDKEGFEHIVYGATAADLGDHRPGMLAAKEAGGAAPLLEAGFTKADVREYSRELGLPTWDKPAMACLSSRFPYGTRITLENLSRVEQSEELLRRGLGFANVRVRDYGATARIEIDPRDLGRLLDQATREQIVSELKALGYTYVTLDLEGFRSGSMNEAVEAELSESRV